MSETALYKPEDLGQSLTAALTACWVLAAGLIWIFSPWSAVFLIVFGTVVAMARLSLRSAVLVFIFLMPFDLHRQIGLGQWLYLDLLTAAIAIPLFKLKRWPPLLCWLLVPFFFYFVLTGAPRSLLPAWFWGYSVRWFIAICFSAAVAMSGAAEEIILAVGITLVPLTVYGIYQLLVGDFGWLYNWMNPHKLDQPWMARSYSLMWHPNAFGNFAGIASVMLIALGVKGYKPKLLYSLGAFGFVALLCSGSRGAEIAVGVGTLILLTQTPNFGRKLAVIAIAATIVWVALQYDVIPLQRTKELDEFTTETRLLVWGEAFIGWQQHPWIGLGATNFSELMENFGNFQTAHAHNTYLQVLAETGVIGFILFYAPFVYLLWRAWKARTVPVVLAAGCALIVWLVHGFVDVELADNPPCLFLLFIAIGLIIGGLSQRNAPAVVDSLAVRPGTLNAV